VVSKDWHRNSIFCIFLEFTIIFFKKKFSPKCENSPEQKMQIEIFIYFHYERVKVHPQLSHNKFLMHDAMMGAGSNNP